MGAGRNEGAGATPPQDMSGRMDAPMDEDGATASLELLSVKEEPLGRIGTACAECGNERGLQSGCTS